MSFFAWLGGYLLALQQFRWFYQALVSWLWNRWIQRRSTFGCRGYHFHSGCNTWPRCVVRRSRTRDFIELEIEEGVKKEVDVKKPNVIALLMLLIEWWHLLIHISRWMAVRMDCRELFLDGLLNIFDLSYCGLVVHYYWKNRSSRSKNHDVTAWKHHCSEM